MADEEFRPFETLLRTVTLEFTVLGGRVFAHNAEPEKLNRQTIELKCEASGSWLFGGDDVVIGNEKHPVPKLFEEEDEDEDDDDGDDEEGAEKKPVDEEEGWRLGTIPTMVSLYQVDDGWFAESGLRNEGKPILGQFEYHMPIQTPDGVVNEKWPKAFAWVGVGPSTFELIRDRLLQFQNCDFSLGLDVLFPEGAVESGFVGRHVRWDGKGQLRITAATIVWKREDWSSDFRHKERLGPKREAVVPYEAPREHVEVMDALRRVEGAVTRLAVPLWMAAAAIIGYLTFRR